jgi:hypothetical protein
LQFWSRGDRRLRPIFLRVFETPTLFICIVLAAVLFISGHPQDSEWLTSSLGRTVGPTPSAAGVRAGLAFGGKTARGLLCTSTGTFTMFTAVTTVGSAREPETLGSFLNPAVAAAKLAQSRYLTSPKNGPLAKISKDHSGVTQGTTWRLWRR